MHTSWTLEASRQQNALPTPLCCFLKAVPSPLFEESQKSSPAQVTPTNYSSVDQFKPRCMFTWSLICSTDTPPKLWKNASIQGTQGKSICHLPSLVITILQCCFPGTEMGFPLDSTRILGLLNSVLHSIYLKILWNSHIYLVPAVYE